MERFLPLARRLARRYRGGSSEPFDDLVQVASLGLVNAVDRFDWKRGTSFSSFAVPTILGELKRYFRDTGWSVHVPRGAQEFAMRVQRAERAVSERTGRSATKPQLAEYLGVSVEEVMGGLQAAAAHYATSLDTPYDDTDAASRSLVELLGDDDEHYQLIVERETIAAAATHLSQREQAMLALRFRDDLTQTQIAQRVGTSQMQVSRALRGTLEQLRLLTAETDQTLPLRREGGDSTRGTLDERRAPANRAPPLRPAGPLPPRVWVRSAPIRMAQPPPVATRAAKVRLLVADPDLAERLPPRVREQAQAALVVRTLDAPVGYWKPPELARDATGLLVLKGFLVRRLKVGQGAACELLGPGDVLRASYDALLEHFVPATPRWQVLQDATLAVLDQRTMIVMNQWAALTDEIVARLLRRVQTLSYLLAIHRFPRTDDRLLLTLWHLASLWGRVRLDGIAIPVPLSHETLAQLVGVRRPSVTASLSSLKEHQHLARDDAGYFVLLGTPPTDIGK